jgi:hypothetical protein
VLGGIHHLEGYNNGGHRRPDLREIRLWSFEFVALPSAIVRGYLSLFKTRLPVLWIADRISALSSVGSRRFGRIYNSGSSAIYMVSDEQHRGCAAANHGAYVYDALPAFH